MQIKAWYVGPPSAGCWGEEGLLGGEGAGRQVGEMGEEVEVVEELRERLGRRR